MIVDLSWKGNIRSNFPHLDQLDAWKTRSQINAFDKKYIWISKYVPDFCIPDLEFRPLGNEKRNQKKNDRKTHKKPEGEEKGKVAQQMSKESIEGSFEWAAN